MIVSTKSLLAATAGLLCVLFPFHIRAQVYASSLGVFPDSLNVNTVAVQKAIETAASHGDPIIFEPGVYVTGSLSLPDNVEIVLSSGATIAGSVDPYDYDGYGDTLSSSIAGLINARGCCNIKITGPGTIDGRGLDLALAIDSLHHTGVRVDHGYNCRRMRPSLRPRLIDFNGVNGLEIRDVRLRGSASWGLSLDKCSNVLISGIYFVNRAYWNNDGIDIADCRDVIVEKCNINSADDGIVLKSFDKYDCNDNITIRDCIVCSSANAIKFGTESFGGFRNVRISDIRVYDTFRSAVAIESVDGATLENVTIDGIDAANTGNAIFVRLGHRHGDVPGVLRNVSVSNLRCDIPFGRPDIEYDLRGPDINVIHNPFPSSITGIPEAHVENVTLENIDISYPGRGTKGMGYIGSYRYRDVPEARDSYPEFHMFGELPAWAFYLRHIDGLTL